MTFEQAVEIAARALAGVKDKFGEPELLHVLRVVVAVPPEARVVAALHDVLEDSELTAEDLEAAGLGGAELEAVLLLTRGEDEPYEEYIERIATAEGEAGRLARVVKLADLRDNLGRVTPELEDLRERYEKAIGRRRPCRGADSGDTHRHENKDAGSRRQKHFARHVVVEAGEIIPGNGTVIEGIASVDESAITGESAPVIREADCDRAPVTAGTRVVWGRIVVELDG